MYFVFRDEKKRGKKEKDKKERKKELNEGIERKAEGKFALTGSALSRQREQAVSSPSSISWASAPIPNIPPGFRCEIGCRVRLLKGERKVRKERKENGVVFLSASFFFPLWVFLACGQVFICCSFFLRRIFF